MQGVRREVCKAYSECTGDVQGAFQGKGPAVLCAPTLGWFQSIHDECVCALWGSHVYKCATMLKLYESGSKAMWDFFVES